MKPYHIAASEYLGQASFKISPLLKVPCRHQSQGNALGFCALASRPQAFSTAGFQVPSHTVCFISLVKADDTYFSLYKDSTKGTTQRYLHIHPPKKKNNRAVALMIIIKVTLHGRSWSQVCICSTIQHATVEKHSHILLKDNTIFNSISSVRYKIQNDLLYIQVMNRAQTKAFPFYQPIQAWQNSFWQ